MNNQDYLGIFQIGPVQDFISKSRKNLDYWSSSFLLSYLSFLVIEGARNKDDIEIVFPCIDDNNWSAFEDNFTKSQNKQALLPNRIMFKFNNSTQDKCTKIMDSFKGIITQKLHELSDKAIDKVFCKDHGVIELKKQSHMQISSFFELYWTIFPFDLNEEKNSIQQTESLFNGRKNIRNFNQNPEVGFKCTVCGERATLHPLRINPAHRNELIKFWKNQTKENHQQYLVRENEHLCGVCLMKRFLPQTMNISTVPSTFTIASAHSLETFIDGINPSNDVQIKEKVRNFYDYCILKADDTNEPVDGSSLLKLRKLIDSKFSTSSEYKKYLTIDGVHFYSDTYKNVKINDFKNLLPQDPTKYYALVSFDGDNVGSLLQNSENFAEYQAVSHHITRFSHDISQKMENDFLLKLIYMGGDDGSYLVNLRDLIPSMIEIQNLFPDALKHRGSSISFGVVIAQSSTPLQQVINESRNALACSKNKDGKNASTFTILKHSGNTVHFAAYHELDDQKLLLPLLQDFYQFYCEEEVGKKWWIELAGYQYTFVATNNDGSIYIDKDLFKLEMKRIFSRKSNHINQNRKKAYADMMDKFLGFIDCGESLDPFFNALETIEFIFREVKP